MTGPQTTEVETTFGRVACFEEDLITSQLRRFGAYQRSNLAALQSLLRLGDHVIDIGAHVGTQTIPFARIVGQTGHVVAFEPILEHFALLKRNIEDNGLGGIAEPIRAAVANSGGPLGIVRVAHNSGGTRLRHDATSSDRILSVTLDEWWEGARDRLPSIELLKIDVEGMELDVLRSATALIEHCRPIVAFEVIRWPEEFRADFEDLDEFLGARGYQYFVNLFSHDDPRDSFKLARLHRLSFERMRGVQFADVIAVPIDSERLPRDVSSDLYRQAFWLARHTLIWTGRAVRKMLFERRTVSR
jgi:FkbM family methyltransferase